MKLLNFKVRDQNRQPRLIYRVRTLNSRFMRHHSTKQILAVLAVCLGFSSSGLAQATVGCLGCDWAALTAPAPIAAPVRRNLRQVADAAAATTPATAPEALPDERNLGRVQVPTNYRIGFRGRLNLDPNAAPASFEGRVTDMQRQRSGRSSLIPAMQNPYTDPAAVRRLVQDAISNRNYRSRGQCWIYVRQALARSGMVPRGTPLQATTPQARVQRLQSAGFRNIVNSNLAMRPEDAPVGSVLIFAHRSNPRDPGDAQIRTETGYVNDFFWPTAFTNQTTGRNFRLIGVMVRDDRGSR